METVNMIPQKPSRAKLPIRRKKSSQQPEPPTTLPVAKPEPATVHEVQEEGSSVVAMGVDELKKEGSSDVVVVCDEVQREGSTEVLIIVEEVEKEGSKTADPSTAKLVIPDINLPAAEEMEVVYPLPDLNQPSAESLEDSDIEIDLLDSILFDLDHETNGIDDVDDTSEDLDLNLL